MKGFADSPTSMTCGAAWTTRTGDSSGPPRTLPAEIAVIVSSKVTQSGSVISGDIRHIVVIHVNPGYRRAPGHTGTGQVVATIC
jgi:hypothetical protein